MPLDEWNAFCWNRTFSIWLSAFPPSICVQLITHRDFVYWERRFPSEKAGNNEKNKHLNFFLAKHKMLQMNFWTFTFTISQSSLFMFMFWRSNFTKSNFHRVVTISPGIPVLIFGHLSPCLIWNPSKIAWGSKQKCFILLFWVNV